MAKSANSTLLQGTLDLLILHTLGRGAQHGYGIAQYIQQVSDEVLRVEEGSLYPALHRLEECSWVRAKWITTENNRRARYYALTSAGRKRLTAERADFERMVAAIQRVLQTG